MHRIALVSILALGALVSAAPAATFEVGAGHGFRDVPGNDFEFGIPGETKPAWGFWASAPIGERFGAGVSFNAYAREVFADSLIEDPADFVRVDWTVLWIAPHVYGMVPVGDGGELRLRAGATITRLDGEALTGEEAIENTDASKTSAYVALQFVHHLHSNVLAHISAEKFFGSVDIALPDRGEESMDLDELAVTMGLGYGF